MAWIIIVPITYGGAKLLLKAGYYRKKRTSKLEAIGAVGGGGIGVAAAYIFDPGFVLMLGMFIGTKGLVAMATTYAMRYNYIVKYGLESSIKVV